MQRRTRCAKGAVWDPLDRIVGMLVLQGLQRNCRRPRDGTGLAVRAQSMRASIGARA